MLKAPLREAHNGFTASEGLSVLRQDADFLATSDLRKRKVGRKVLRRLRKVYYGILRAIRPGPLRQVQAVALRGGIFSPRRSEVFRSGQAVDFVDDAVSQVGKTVVRAEGRIHVTRAERISCWRRL